LSYSPRYFADLRQAISIVKSNLPLDVRDSVNEFDIEVHLEQTEMNVDNFLVSSGFNLSNLDSETKANGRILHTYRALLSLLNILPMNVPAKQRLELRWEEVIIEVERRLTARKFPLRLVKPVLKRIGPGWAMTREHAEEWGEEHIE